jgi:hypothetical protein
MGGCKSLMLFLCGGFFCCFLGKKDSRLCFCFFMLRRKRGGNMYGIYAMAASGRMQYDYIHTYQQSTHHHTCIAAYDIGNNRLSSTSFGLVLRFVTDFHRQYWGA